MNITILGGGGFLGQRIARHLASEGKLGGRPIDSLTLFDLKPPPAPTASFRVGTLGGDIAALPAEAIPAGTDIVFHLAAVVSAAAEADYDLGQRVNIDGTRAVIDACRRISLHLPGRGAGASRSAGKPPRVVFTSSVASFSGGQDACLPDDARQIPANSYGAQKAIGELLLADATRRGFLDAVILRLPTVVVRPGRPNKAASSFVSSILREPLLGLDTDLPVPDDFAVWIASPRRATEWLLHAATMDSSALGLDRSITPPGVKATVAELLLALEKVRPGASAHVHRRPDPVIAGIVGGWPAAFSAQRGIAMGFAAHEPLAELITGFIADDLEATRRERASG